MKLLGIDYGKQKIGVAISTEGEFATPLMVIKEGDRGNQVSKIVKISQNEGIEKIILGIPVGVLEKEIQSFRNSLSKETGLEVILFDENYSTKIAGNLLKAGNNNWRKIKGKEDAAAAAVILQDYLDSQK